VIFWTIDPEQTTGVVNEMATSTLRDLWHGPTSDNPVSPA
jgi:hypothetical protein